MIKKGECFKITGICKTDACRTNKAAYVGETFMADDEYGMTQRTSDKAFTGSATNISNGIHMYFYAIQLKRIKRAYNLSERED